MSISLAEIQESIKSEIKVNSEGKGFITIRGAARLAGVKHTTLLQHFSSGREKASKLSAFLTHYGFDSGRQESFSKGSIPDLALGLLLNYYAMYADNNCTSEAKMAVMSFTAIGVRSWLQKSVGYVEPQRKSRARKAKELEPVITDQEILTKIHVDLIKHCKGEPRTTGFFGCGHHFVRRMDVLAVFGIKGKYYLTKPQIIKLFKSAEAAGFGSLKVDGKKIYTFTPFNSQPLLTA
jgi:hypothetical protein